MPRKPKFRPRITRVKLNPEQAVLTCNCYFDHQVGLLNNQVSSVSLNVIVCTGAGKGTVTAYTGAGGEPGHVVVGGPNASS